MDSRIKLAAALTATLAIGAAPTFAREVVVYSTATPTTSYYYVPAERTYYYVPEERTYYYAPDPATYYTPPLSSYYEQPVVTTRVYEARRIEVEAPRYNTDQRITHDVVDTLAGDPRLSGKIGVVTDDRTVHLTGRVSTPGQAEIAARDAMSVDGVREVRNELRSRVGGSR